MLEKIKIEDLPRIQIYASICKISKDGPCGFQLRHTFQNKEIIKIITSEILKYGVFYFIGEVSFRDKKNAMLRLKESNFI